MDILIQRLIVFGNKIVAELRRLTDLVQENISATRESNRAREEHNRPTPEVRAVLNAPQGIEVKKSASDTADERHYQNRSLLVQWITFIAIVVYAIVTWLSYQELIGATGAAQQAVQESRLNRQQSEKALVAAVDNFHVDQRAWVGQRDFREPTFSAGENFVVSLNFSNSGKTPATGLTTQMAVDPEPKGVRPNFEKLPAPLSRGVLQPNAIGWIDINPVTDSSGDGKPLGKTGYDVIYRGDMVIWVYGIIHYSDVFAFRHWTTFCYTFQPKTKAFQMYKEHNDQDKEYR